ncbi:hypothetical protein BGX28_009156 [Mortierella sp. GBA30]|nr:hypothetical protein BGX28_009156 [Mortierella sp. GBA30]
MVQVVKEGYGGYVVMDAVDNILAGEFISIALRNVGPESVLVKSVRVIKGFDTFKARLLESSNTISLYPSAHRPIAIRLELLDERKLSANDRTSTFSLEFQLESVGVVEGLEEKMVTRILETDILVIKHCSWGEVYKYTFLDFDGTVQYAAAIPPSKPSSQATDSAPVLVSLHGAAVEVAQSPFWLSEYVQRERTWIVLPTGRSSWGYDWHGASAKNVMGAIQSLAHHLYGVPNHLKDLPGMKPDPNRLFMAGHSNGGQGAWYLVTHFPDKAIAATPAASYVNIKQYVPYTGWLSNSHTDSHIRGLLEASIVEFDNDVHMSNAVGIPILARTGSVDDNVPPFNSRKMVRLGQENAHNLTAISLSEIPGAGHWFEGVLHDDTMQAFLGQHLLDNSNVKTYLAQNTAGEERYPIKAVTYPPFPNEFEITVLNPAGMGSKGGIQVEQLRIPFRKGTVKVKIIKQEHQGKKRESSTMWTMETTNIRRLRILDSPSLRLRRGRVSKLVLDGVAFDVGSNEGALSLDELSSGSFLRERANKRLSWQFTSSNEWINRERHRETYGPAIQILEKRVIVVLGTHFEDPSAMGSEGRFAQTAKRIAQSIAHDIYLYGRGDVEIITDKQYGSKIQTLGEGEKERANLILVGDVHQNSVTKLILAQMEQEAVIIDSQEGVVSIQPRSDNAEEVDFRLPGTGLLMIRPWGPSHLAMLIAGIDDRGMETAARLFPKRTGLMVPDWGPEMAWKGAGGILAAGYWGNHWEYLMHMSA